MSSSDKSSRGVQIGLLIFGIPFIAAISALTFLPQLPTYVAANTNAILAAAGIGALGVLLTFLLAWFADRRTVHRLDETIKKLEAKSERHALELALKQQEFDQQLELLTQKAQIGDLENELKTRELKLELAEAQQTTPDSASGESVEDSLAKETEPAVPDQETIAGRKNPIRTVASSSERVKESR